MIKIGLVGEDPYDTESIKRLLLQKYNGKAQFIPLVKRIRGTQLDTRKFFNLLESAIESDSSISNVILIRDLDGLSSETWKLNAKKEWHRKCQSCSQIKKYLLLNIYELEALILGDVDFFNKKYGCRIKIDGKPSSIKKPKDLLISKTRNTTKRYRVAHNPEIFEKINFSKVLKVSSELKEVIEKLDDLMC
ncbi:MAG: DUF4276 family protein [Ekhidna sp.]|uniref:hypothetical protein n=1 Tax=Ekhidna sp. TaxID=2608089 RepID=UPI0032EED067